jgi:dolichol-phosphate mannosyltransferase
MGVTSESEEGGRREGNDQESVSVIIPTYNERENIKTTLDRCACILEAAEYKYELIVVDDNSPDRTWAFVKAAYDDNDRVRVLRRTANRGLAVSIIDGFHVASMKSCVVIDADLQHPPEKIPELLAALEDGADIAIGSRHLKEGEIESWSRFRRAVSRGATTLAKRSLPTAESISDPMSGLFAVRRTVISNVELQPKGYKILLEILSKCEVEQVAEVPYVFRKRAAGESKLTVGEYQKFLEHLAELSVGEYAKKIGENSRRIVRMVEFFGVGTVGILINSIVFLLAMNAGLHYLESGGLAFLTAVQWNFAGNWAITFNRPRDSFAKRYLSFHAVCMVGLVIYEVVLSLLLFVPGLPILLANFGAIGVSSLWNFVGADTTAFADDIDSEDSSVGIMARREAAGNIEGSDN